MGAQVQPIPFQHQRILKTVARKIYRDIYSVFEESAHAQVRLAKEAREQAVIALEKEPEDDLAQHLMGRWHSEMANINGVVRALIRLMYGTDLATGTHADALCHYRRAAELNPARLVHRCALVHFETHVHPKSCTPALASDIIHPCRQGCMKKEAFPVLPLLALRFLQVSGPETAE